MSPSSIYREEFVTPLPRHSGQEAVMKSSCVGVVLDGPPVGGDALAQDLDNTPAAIRDKEADKRGAARNSASDKPGLPPVAAGVPALPKLPVNAAWRRRLDAVKERQGQPAAQGIVPRAPQYYVGQLTPVQDAAGAQALLEFARQRPLAFIGFDTEFRYDRPGVVVSKHKTAYDPSSIRPFLLALALAEPDDPDRLTFYRFVVDLRVPDVLPALADLLRLPCCFVGHYTHAELLCLFKLGLPEPRQLWDTWVAEKARYLGQNHKNYKSKPGADEGEQTRAAAELEEEDAFSYGLVSTCRRYGVPYPFAGDKDRLQRSFLDHPADAPFSREQLEYAAADAISAASLYLPQVTAATLAGIRQHLDAVEMQWVVTNARMAWRGVRKDQALCRRVEQAAREHLAKLQAELARRGIANAESFVQLRDFFERQGLLHLFRRGGKISFDKQMLEEFEGHHPVIPLLRAARRINSLLEGKILTDEFVGADGRVHPNYTQLGTHTGRQASWGPNVLGIGKVFRPLIIADPGRGLGEVDLSQIEVGVTAAVYHDEQLAEMFNTGDVYSAMAQLFFRKDLPAEDRDMPSQAFKKKYGSLRAKMKICTLGIIYGLTPHGLALRLKTSRAEAAALQERFMSMFPALKRGLARTPAFGAMCGYVSTSSGLRRSRDRRSGPLSNWERNWMTNHPVQGSAAYVFKVAGNRLDRLYRRYDAWLLVPLHDAYLFEAPLEVLPDVARLTEKVLCEAVQEHYPQLRPRAEVNIEHPACWNKDGRSDSVERWLEDPVFSL
jgi:DNA polymerase-1